MLEDYIVSLTIEFYSHYYNNSITVALGVECFFGDDPINDSETFFLPQLNYIYGVKHHLELGTGTIVDYRLENTNLMVPFQIGYRYQKPTGGIFWKIQLAVLIYEAMFWGELGGFVLPWPGIAFGWSF